MAFEPSTLSNKRLWLRARDLTLGQTVTAWADKSGLNRHPSTFSGGQIGTFQDAFAVVAATASASYQAPLKAFQEDGDFWESGGGLPQWLQAQIDQPRAATVYSFTPRPGWTGRAPSSWVFMGSNDGTTWTNLDSRTNQPAWGESEIRVFKFTNTTPYLYYRLHVTAASGASLVNLSNMRIGTEVNNPVVWHGFGGLVGLVPENSTSAERELWIRFRPFGYTWGVFADLGTDSGSSHFPGADGNSYLDTFRTNRPGFAHTGLVIRQWQLLRVSLTAAGVWTVHLNGTQLIQQTGVVKGDSPSPTLVSSWPGQISEVLIRDKVSSASEVSDLTTYFNSPPPDVNTAGSGLYDFAGTQREVFRWDGAALIPVTWNRF